MYCIHEQIESHTLKIKGNIDQIITFLAMRRTRLYNYCIMDLKSTNLGYPLKGIGKIKE